MRTLLCPIEAQRKRFGPFSPKCHARLRVDGQPIHVLKIFSNSKLL